MSEDASHEFQLTFEASEIREDPVLFKLLKEIAPKEAENVLETKPEEVKE